MSQLDRYRPLVDDFPAFAEASRAPLPRVVWAHLERIRPDALRARLEERGLVATPLAFEGAFRIDGTTRPGHLLEYRLGLCHVQEEVSLVPPELLQPRPGERILDACAAPGGKTARIAIAMRGRGTVVANDRSPGRLRALSNLVERLGLVNVVATRADAAKLPRPFGRFDRILCDVPCSGEGTSRKNPRVLTEPVADRPALARLQREIVIRSSRLLRPGGRLVYSTCTYAPEENEAVVDAALRDARGALRVVPAAVAGIPTTPGVTAWNGDRFDASLVGALRFWPHLGDGGGFFAAVLEKAEDAPPPREEEAPPPFPDAPTDADGLVRRFATRFGLPERALDGLAFRAGSKKRLTMESADLRPPPEAYVVHRGVPFAHRGAAQVLPTTCAARRFGSLATENVVALDVDDLDLYVARRPVPLAGRATDGPARGFVLVVHDGVAVGNGVVRDGPDGPWLESSFPKPSTEPGA